MHEMGVTREQSHRRKSPVIPISVMPLRENEKVYPVICAKIRSHVQLLGKHKTYGMYAVSCVQHPIPPGKMEARPHAGHD